MNSDARGWAAKARIKTSSLPTQCTHTQHSTKALRSVLDVTEKRANPPTLFSLSPTTRHFGMKKKPLFVWLMSLDSRPYEEKPNRSTFSFPLLRKRLRCVKILDSLHLNERERIKKRQIRKPQIHNPRRSACPGGSQLIRIMQGPLLFYFFPC